MEWAIGGVEVCHACPRPSMYCPTRPIAKRQSRRHLLADLGIDQMGQ
jgi:hypothetical protein